MAVEVSAEMRAKLAAVDDYAILDSETIAFKHRPERAEKVLGTKGWYISSPEDGWTLRGPFAEG